MPPSALQQQIDEALKHHAAGRFKEAEAIYRKILAAEPNHPGALHLLGVAASQQNRKPEAVQLISRAISLQPQSPEFHANLALVYIEQGIPEKAIPCCHAALRLKSDYADAHNHLGAALRMMGRLDQAITSLRTALQLNPNHTDATSNLAAALEQLGRHTEAAELLKKLQALRPRSPETFIRLGEASREQKRFAEALDCFKQALAIDPNCATAHNGMGAAYQEMNQLDQAIACYQKAISLDPNLAGAHNNLGFALSLQGQIDSSIDCYNRALSLRPAAPEVYNNLGNALLSKLDIEGSMAAYNKALYFQPDHADGHWNKALLQLLTANFENAWREYEWRWLKFPDQKRYFRPPQWDGSDISGKTILLHAEQGFGDAIQFIRYAPMVVQQRDATVYVECQPELVALFRNLPGVSRTIARGDTLPPFDCHCPLLSLPFAFNTALQTIPATGPYLTADPSLTQIWKRKLAPHNDKLKIGLAWAGAAIHRKDRERSLPPSVLSPLASGDRALISLQKGPSTAGIPDALPSLIDFTSDLTDFADTAALIANLDLVICADTAVAHLAGALGKPVWLLIAYSPDWRWMLDRDDSPWYPTMKLFRQKSPGDWPEVISRVASELSTFK